MLNIIGLTRRHFAAGFITLKAVGQTQAPVGLERECDDFNEDPDKTATAKGREPLII